MKKKQPNYTSSEIYEKLRSAHSLIKDIINIKGFENTSNEKKNAIDAVHSVLYLAEGHFTDF